MDSAQISPPDATSGPWYAKSEPKLSCAQTAFLRELLANPSGPESYSTRYWVTQRALQRKGLLTSVGTAWMLTRAGTIRAQTEAQIVAERRAAIAKDAAPGEKEFA